jgi:hypothetical protein
MTPRSTTSPSTSLARVRELGREQQLAGAAAIGLVLSTLLPWYSKSALAGDRFVETSLSAWGIFSFVEAAVLLVAVGVLYLLWARSQRRAFHLPGGDGVVVFAAGIWAVLLLIWRLFDKPDVSEPGATVGIAFGFFVALGAAAALAAAGAKLRAAHIPEPPNPAETAVDVRRRRRPVDPAAVTEVLRDPPRWNGDPPEAPERVKPAEPKSPPPDGRLF